MCLLKGVGQLSGILSSRNFGLGPVGRLTGIFTVINMNYCRGLRGIDFEVKAAHSPIHCWA